MRFSPFASRHTEKAFDSKRPAVLLLEDSIRIFEEKELPPLENWDGKTLFASDPVYSTPLKTRKKQLRVRSKKRKAANRSVGKKKKKKSGPWPQAASSDISPLPVNQSPTPFNPAGMVGQIDKLVEAVGILTELPEELPELPLPSPSDSAFDFSPMGQQVDNLVEAVEAADHALGNAKIKSKPSQVLSGATSPPPLEFSPIGNQLDKLVEAAEAIGIATSFAAV